MKNKIKLHIVFSVHKQISIVHIFTTFFLEM